MTIDDQLRDLARRAEEHQRVITTDEIVRRVSTEHETSTIDPWRSGRTQHRRAAMRLALAGLLAAAVAGIVVIRSNDHTSPADQPSTTLIVSPTTPPPPPPTATPPLDTTGVPATTTPSGWSGPVRDASTVVQPMAPPEDVMVDPSRTWQDPLDAAESWVDLQTVGFSDDYQALWNIDLATDPPVPADRDARLNIAYGLVLDTTGDGDADFLIGIDDAAPVLGEKRTWVTDLATGETDEQIGPPYGLPVEFRHPDERQPADPPGFPSLMFTFLGDSRPADLDGNVRFYVWTSATLDGEVIAWDFAPDIGWITPAPLEPISEPELYVTNIFGESDEDTLQAAIDQSVPGSPAEAYATWQRDFQAAAERDRRPVEPGTVTADGDSVIACAVRGICSVYSDFTVRGGLIESFTIDGTEISSRLGGPSPPVTNGPATVTVTSSFQAINESQFVSVTVNEPSPTFLGDQLGVNLEVDALGQVDFNFLDVSYVDPTGQQIAVNYGVGDPVFVPWISKPIVVFFPGGTPGGRIVFKVIDADATTSTADNTFDFEIAVPALA